ncbi:hypothetical protein CRUP_029492, partial [Coryphaenoides rupestris]
MRKWRRGSGNRLALLLQYRGAPLGALLLQYCGAPLGALLLQYCGAPLGALILLQPTRHADGLFTSGYSRLLGQLSAKDYLESLIAKRVNGDLVDPQLPVKRHSDAVFTDNYSRFRKQMAAKKYLNSILSGKR